MVSMIRGAGALGVDLLMRLVGLVLLFEKLPHVHGGDAWMGYHVTPSTPAERFTPRGDENHFPAACIRTFVIEIMKANASIFGIAIERIQR
ncbi:MAG: hypothetical protein RLZZ505_1968 [Verrucomicrobiota bacterium]